MYNTLNWFKEIFVCHDVVQNTTQHKQAFQWHQMFYVYKISHIILNNKLHKISCIIFQSIKEIII